MKYSYQQIGRHLDFLDQLPHFPVLFVSLLLRRMFPTMSTTTTQWIFVASLNGTLLSLLCYALVASKNMHNHVLLRRSQQMQSNSNIDTTPHVVHCPGPIFCPFCLAQFTVKRSRTSYSRTSATCRIVDKNLTFRFYDKHAGVAEVEFISFSLNKILWHQHVWGNRGLAGDALRLMIHSRMRYDQGPIDSGDALIHSIFAETLYTSNMDVGCSQWGIFASTMTPQHHTGSAIPQFS